MSGEQQSQLFENGGSGSMPIPTISGHRFGRLGSEISHRHTEHVGQALQYRQSFDRKYIALDLRNPAFRAPDRGAQLFLR